MHRLDEIVKAYDIRGTVPDQLSPEVAHALGVAFARYAARPEMVVARDMRPSGPALVDAFVDGVLSQGVDVCDIGLASSDLLYFASGSRDVPGAIFTASHNPAQYNGVKMCLAGARPVDTDGLGEIKAVASTVLDGHGSPTATRGRRRSADLLGAFVDHVTSFVDPSTLRPLRVVADTANGMGGLVVPAVFERLASIELEVMYGELDGTFPNHPADPLQPANQRDLRARVVSGGFDLGLAFDGDADRVFVVDESGAGLSGSTTTAMLAAAILRSHAGATVLHNLICSRAVPEVIREHGGVPVRTKVGHSFIKQVMAETGAVFGGEHSAHYYFADNFRADSGLIASVLLLEELSRSQQQLSVVRKPFERYAQSGEINTHVADPVAVMGHVADAIGDCEQDHLDGLSVDCDTWWFNLRPSNTEPLLRLNLEAVSLDECERRVAEILSLVTSV
ncbi:MAG: phosphomannomutase/phosphoglucomutase [Acidimicrobiia bacterium]|nr:phosphomannomutase/phosphoglucomutase [Acidimicrobiia bacterium]